MRDWDLPETTGSPAVLSAKQQLFASLLGLLYHYASVRGWQLTLAEGYIGDSSDKPGEDTPHKRTGLHFLRLAQDLNLFIDGTYIKSGGHTAWKELGTFWESLHELARNGRSWGDANHFSLAHNGKA
jgi:hypothetical protein